MEKPEKSTRQIVEEYWKKQERPKTVNEILEYIKKSMTTDELTSESHGSISFRVIRRLVKEYRDSLEEPKTISQIVEEYWNDHPRAQVPEEEPAVPVSKVQIVKKEPEVPVPEKKFVVPVPKKEPVLPVNESQEEDERTEFSLLVFEGGRTYNNITNFESLSKTSHHYKFDSEWNEVITCIEIRSRIIRKEYERFTEKTKASKMIAEHCSKLTVYVHSGKREEFSNVENVKEFVLEGIVEFDTIVDGKEAHMKMAGTIEKCLEVFEESSN